MEELEGRRRPEGGSNRVASDLADPLAGRADDVAAHRRRRIRGRRSRRRSGLGLAPKELLLAKTDHRLEPLNFGFELGLALKGSGVLGLPVGGLTKRLEILIQPWANRTGTLRQGRSGTDRSSRRRLRRRTGRASVKTQDRNAQGSETKHGGGTVIHVG